MVHGGLADKTVSSHVAVLEVHAKVHPVPPRPSSAGGTARAVSGALPESPTPQPPVADEVQAHESKRATSPPSPPRLADALPRLGSADLGGATSPGAKAARSPPRVGAAPPFQVLSSMFEGMYRGVGNLSSDAVGALQRATGNAAMDPDAATATEAAAPEREPTVEEAPEVAAEAVGRIQYTRPPAPADLGADVNGAASLYSYYATCPQGFTTVMPRIKLNSRLNLTQTRGMRFTRLFAFHAGASDQSLREWMVTHGSSPCHAGRDVIVPTSDFLTTSRGGGAAAQTQGKGASAAQQSSAMHDAGEAAAQTQMPNLLSADLPGLSTPAGVQDKRSDEGSGGSESRPESPVSLWISPQQHPLFAAQSTRHEPSGVQLAIAELVDSIVAQVDSRSSLPTEPETSGGAHEMEQSNSFQFEAAHPANDEQYPDRWPLGRVSIDKTSATRAECVPLY